MSMTVTLVSENVYYQWKNTTEWSPMTCEIQDLVLDYDDQLSTDRTGWARAVLSDGTNITVPPYTVISITHSRQDSQQGQSGSFWKVIWDIINCTIDYRSGTYHFFFDRDPAGAICSTAIRG